MVSSPPLDLATQPARSSTNQFRRARRALWRGYALEWLLLLLLAVLYSHTALLTFDPLLLQQSSEHNEAATLHVITAQALQAGVVPLWNPYMSSGFPVAGDFVSNFWNPAATLPVWLFGGVNGYKVAAFLAFLAAAWGQWTLARVLGLRAPLRVWSAALFMLSGGLALFWRLGWHQLLVGAAWFPWSFAALVWALRSRRRAPLALAAVAAFMVLSSAGGYYFLYLGVSLAVLSLLLVAVAPAGRRLPRLGRAIVVALLTLGLCGVILIPGRDVLRHTARETLGDTAQSDSQPIRYALFQFVVSDHSWLDTETLGQFAGFTWFYIGALPLLGLIGLPLAVGKRRTRREAVLVAGTLALVFLAWHANRHNFIRYIYDAFPALYQFRFVSRLLVPATSPLIILGAFGIQGLWSHAQRPLRRVWLGLEVPQDTTTRHHRLSLRNLATLGLLLVLAFSVRDVFRVNQGLAFGMDQARDQRPLRALQWLHEQDPGLYNVEAGDWRIWWWWTTAAYELRQPLLNFAYNRRTTTFIAQQQNSGASVRATPKYIFPWSDNLPANATLLNTVDGQPVYVNSNALPYAFAAPSVRLAQAVPLVANEVQALDARWVNPNQLVVRVEDGAVGQHLVALVSSFPGWKVYVDGAPAALETINDYLAVPLRAGAHRYTFSFEPKSFYQGLALSGATLLLALVLLVSDRLTRPRRRTVTVALPRAVPEM